MALWMAAPRSATSIPRADHTSDPKIPPSDTVCHYKCPRCSKHKGGFASKSGRGRAGRVTGVWELVTQPTEMLATIEGGLAAAPRQLERPVAAAVNRDHRVAVVLSTRRMLFLSYM